MKTNQKAALFENSGINLDALKSEIAAMRSARERAEKLLDAIHGEAECGSLASAARTGLLIALARMPSNLPDKFDPRLLTVLPNSDMEDAIVDAMTDLAALARVSGLDEEGHFGSRFMYSDGFKTI